MSMIATLAASLSEVSSDDDVEAVTLESSAEVDVGGVDGDVLGFVRPFVLGFVGPTIVGAMPIETKLDVENVVGVPIGTTCGGAVPIGNGEGVTRTAVVQLKRQQKDGEQLFRQLVSFSAMTTQLCGNWPGPLANWGAVPVSRLKEMSNDKSDVR